MYKFNKKITDGLKDLNNFSTKNFHNSFFGKIQHDKLKCHRQILFTIYYLLKYEKAELIEVTNRTRIKFKCQNVEHLSEILTTLDDYKYQKQISVDMKRKEFSLVNLSQSLWFEGDNKFMTSFVYRDFHNWRKTVAS